MPASAANTAALGPNGNKTLLTNGKPVLVEGPKIFLEKNPPSWYLGFSVVCFNKIYLFSRYLKIFL